MTTRYIAVLSLAVLIFSALLVASCSGREKQGLIACWKFDEGKGNRLLDASGNGNHGEIHGAAWTKGRVGEGLLFDGVDDYVKVLKSASLNSIRKEITLMCWIKTPLPARHSILARWPCGSGDRSVVLDVDSEGKLVRFALSPDGGHGLWHKRLGFTSADRWVHIAATSNGKTMRIYLNGEPDPSPSVPEAPQVHTSTTDLYIGAWQSGLNKRECFFKGSMDEIKIYSRTLSHEEILNDYKAGSPKGTVAGRVTDTNGKPIRAAKVKVGFFGTTTDREGRYKIVVPAETYEAVVSRKGYQREIKADVVVGKGKAVEMNAALTADNTAPSISSEVKIKDADDVSATVGWRTDEACTGKVKYGTSSRKYDKVAKETSYVKSHRITLAGLIPNTKYYFTMESEDKGENTVKSKEQTFTTLAVDNPHLVARRLKESMKMLLKRLDLDRPGLEKVKASADDPSKAAKELLAYYRARTSVKHFVNHADREKSRGKYASAGNMKTADNALKHIFVSFGAYPPHFCGKDIDWASSPVPDIEWIVHLHYVHWWNDLARAYWHTGDEKYAREWCFQLADWVRKNPRDSKHEYAWRRLEAGGRGIAWTGVFQHFLDSPSFTPDVLVTFLNSCYDHASYLTERFSPGNWGQTEALGAEFLAITFPEFRDAKKWRDKALEHLKAETMRQVRDDGHQIEQTLGYHCGCIGRFARAYEFARINGLGGAFGDQYHRRVEKMVEVLMKLGFPNGTSAQFGDTSHSVHVRRSLKKYAGVFGRKDFLYVATAGKEGTPPKQTAYALTDSGFYSIRSGWDEKALCLVLKCGPDGKWHCQPDNGTFELFAGGRRLMPDSGTYIYSGDPAGRAWFRQTRVHQTLTLDGENSAYKPAQRLWKTGKDLDVLVVENGSYDGLTHRRAVMFVKKKFFVLVDDAIGKADGDVDLHFQLAPGKAVFDKSTFSARTDFKKGANVLIRGLAQEAMKLQKEKGQVSFKYGQKQPRPAFRFRIKKTSDTPSVRFVTLIIPYEGKVPEAKVSIVSSPAPGANRIELDVTVGDTTARVGYDLEEKKAWIRATDKSRLR